MRINQDIDACFGSEGLDVVAFETLARRADPVTQELGRQIRAGKLPIFALPTDTTDLPLIERTGKALRDNFGHIVILGTGGSSLGGQMLCALRGRFPAQGPRITFLDNIDPDTLEQFLASTDFADTAFLVISKSGATVETQTQCLVCLDAVKSALGEAALKKHFTFITVPGSNALRALAAQFAIPVLDHDPGVGGRFSSLSLVGLIPAVAAGVDIRAVRNGMAEVLEETLTRGAKSAAARGAALQVALMESGKRIAVLMPYADSLAEFGVWVRQIWAESLGKQGKGSLLVNALGTVDQHSQLQLYLDGPRDKSFTIILPKNAGRGPCLNVPLAASGALEYLAGHSVGDVFAANGQATTATLIAKGYPVRIMRMEALEAADLGALIGHFMLETAITAGLLGVDAYDQPAVEEGKVLARRMLAEKKLREQVRACQ